MAKKSQNRGQHLGKKEGEKEQQRAGMLELEFIFHLHKVKKEHRELKVLDIGGFILNISSF